MTQHLLKPSPTTTPNLPRNLFNHPRLFTGLGALALGTLLYLLDRPAERTYFIPQFLADALQPDGGAGLFGGLGQQLPTFLHTFAFCLLTAALLRVGVRGSLAICSGWLMIDAAFEIGQHPDIAPVLARWTPDWFSAIPVLDNTAGYFLNGRFDPYDLISIVVGAVLALPLILATRRFDPPGDSAADNV